MSSVVGIVPARWASTRFPGKPLHLIAGKPLIQHVWERACLAEALDRVIIATDDMRIAEAAFAFGAEVSLTKESHPSGTDRAAEVAARLRKITHIINIQGDEPGIDPALINRLACRLKESKGLQMITAATPFPPGNGVQDPNQVKVVLGKSNHALYFSRSPIPFVREVVDGGVTFYRHLGIYGYRRTFLQKFVKWPASILENAEKLEQLRALERGVIIEVVITESDSPGIDTREDADAFERTIS